MLILERRIVGKFAVWWGWRGSWCCLEGETRLMELHIVLHGGIRGLRKTYM